MTLYLVGGIILALCVVLYFARKGGKDAVKASIGKANADAAKRIAESQASAPRTKSDVVVRLRDKSKPL